MKYHTTLACRCPLAFPCDHYLLLNLPINKHIFFIEFHLNIIYMNVTFLMLFSNDLQSPGTPGIEECFLSGIVLLRLGI